MIIAIFDVPTMSMEKFNKVWDALRSAGNDHPDGRIHHYAGTKGDGMVVVDIWESPEKLGAFAEILMPVLSGLGITPTQPTIIPITYQQEG